MYKAMKEDIERSKRIIEEEYEKCGKIINESELGKAAEDVLNTSYSIGGGYDEVTLRKIVQSLIKRNLS